MAIKGSWKSVAGNVQEAHWLEPDAPTSLCGKATPPFGREWGPAAKESHQCGACRNKGAPQDVCPCPVCANLRKKG
jgi:hypothetical protein